MGRMTTFIVIMVGMTLLFHFMGLIENTPNSALLNLALNPESITDNTFYQNMLFVFTGLGLGGLIILGTISKNFELVAMAPFVILLLYLLLDFIAVFQVAYVHLGVLAILLFSPFIVMFIITCLDWWRGVS